jgi:hypothetical protein
MLGQMLTEMLEMLAQMLEQMLAEMLEMLAQILGQMLGPLRCWLDADYC